MSKSQRVMSSVGTHLFNGLGRHLALMHDLDHKDLVVPPPPALHGLAKGSLSQLLQCLILNVEGPSAQTSCPAKTSQTA